MDKKDTRSAYSLVLFDSNMQRRADQCYDSNLLGVVSVPTYWRHGDLRPLVEGELLYPFMEHGMGPYDLQWIHIPMLFYSDDLFIVNGLQSKAGGFIWV